METIENAEIATKEARAEFEARLKVAFALAQQLNKKLIEWGRAMEASASC